MNDTNKEYVKSLEETISNLEAKIDRLTSNWDFISPHQIWWGDDK
jgi:hypothetical protein